jgi:hypothetical protein
MLRKLAFAAPVLVVVAAAIGCGGKVDVSLLPVCPSDGTCTSDCKETVTDCSGTYDLSCTCDATGKAQCPELGMPKCANDCDQLLSNHSASCSVEGEKCLSPVQDACLGGPTLYCTCESGHFFCDSPPPDCNQPSCPPPSQVQPGLSCSGMGLCPTDQPILDCDGNVAGYVECSCMGGTFGDCIAPPPPSCIDGGPILVDAGTFDGGQPDQ